MAKRRRRRQHLTGVDLAWTEEERRAFKGATHSSPLQYPSEAVTINLFCDASATGWAVVLTQLLNWDPNLGAVEQAHQLLVCQGGTFTHSELSWSVTEKEAYYRKLRQRVKHFSRQCLLCKHVKGGHLLLRKWQEHEMATKRNKWLHGDYLFLGESYGDARYVLVLKDELTLYTELVARDSPTSLVAATAILD
ncbi:hypothetical protein PHMEG_0007627 [Phytophthora megakarya]|uniref:Uncharacterized protein n=1 Tax=Phytophthora megakarya TaxID=4795 RepID=A0A225WL69_9STRA|nr:hypothetical protein PHMEG_0007627 [Phytophthora megakarya]